MRKSATGGSRADEGVRPTSAGSGAVASGVVFGVAKSGEGFQDSGNFGEAGAGEIASDDFGCDRGGCLHQVIAHGTDAIGEVRRPGKARGAGGLLLFLLHLHAEAGLGGGGALKLGPEPSHQTGTFFGGTGGVKLDQAEKDVFGGQFRGPAVGLGDGAIQIVVEVSKDRYEAVVVNHLAGGRERLAGAELLDDVVHFGERQVGMCFLAAFAM